MRILVDYRPALRERTGVGEYVHELAKALARQATGDRNDQITLFTSSWKDRPDPALASEMPASVRVVDSKVPVRGLVWAWNRLEWPAVEWLAGAHDVVHSQSPLLIPSRDAAQVVTIHDLDFLNNPELMTAEIRRDYPVLARSHAVRADAVIVSSHYAAGEVTRQLGIDRARIHICSPGQPAWAAGVRTRRAADPRRDHILFVGTLSARKNVATLLRAYARLAEQSPGVPPLVLAGHRTGYFDTQCASLCDQAATRHRVMVTGYVETPRRIDLYERAAMLVLPSYEEGFGLPVLEAMSCGVPVVVSSRGSLPEVAGAAASPIDPDDIDGLSGAMRALLDPDCAAAAIARGLVQAARYEWAACATAARGAYQAAIDIHRRPERGHAPRH